MQLVELHRSTKAACEHRAFVLKAVGIASEVIPFEDSFVLFVAADAVPTARRQLDLYYTENATVHRREVPIRVREFAWAAPFVYAIALCVIGFAAGKSFFGEDWYAAGALSSALGTDREWWRAITALTLHVDHQHLLSNMGFGAVFLYAASRLIGSGVALAGVVIAAILGNLLDQLLVPAHISIGASTLVFATLGLVSAYSWRLQFSARLRWAHRWAPLIVGIMLLGFLGASGENTDVLAHLTGFLFGALCGVLFVRLPARLFDSVAVQIVCAAASVALFGVGWYLALK